MRGDRSKGTGGVDESDRRVAFLVEGTADSRQVNKALVALPGVRSAVVHLEMGRVEVRIDPRWTSDDELLAALESEGLSVAPSSSEPI